MPVPSGSDPSVIVPRRSVHDLGGPDSCCTKCGVHVLDVTGPCPGRSCPDQGACHHACRAGQCFRVHQCGPLSGAYPGDRWPAAVTAAYADGGVL